MYQLIRKAPAGKVVKLNGSEMFELDYPNDRIFIYDGYESQNVVINYISGKQNSDVFKQQSSGQIMDIVFKRYNQIK